MSDPADSLDEQTQPCEAPSPVEPTVIDPLVQRLNDEVTAILKEIPSRLAIRAIIVDAHARFSATGLPPQVILEKVAEVLREIATHAVEEFTSRTRQPFHWVDDPEPPAEEMVFMTFGFDEKGNLTST